MGEEGFSSDSSLLYHRGVPSAIVDSQVWELADQRLTPNHPLKPRHLKLHDLSRRGRVSGRGPPAGARQRRRPDQLRGHRHRRVPALPQRHRRRVRLRRERAPARSRRCSAWCPTAPATTSSCPRATDHRWVPAEPSRLYAIEANSHIHPPKRYLSRFGQLLEHAPYCERDLHGPPSRPRRRQAAERRRGPGQAPHVGRRRRQPADLRHPPVRRRRLGRLPLPLHVQHRGLHADHRQGPPAAAGPPGLRGLELRGLQLPAPQGRLPRARRSRCPTTTPTSTPTRSCSTSAATTRRGRGRASTSARSRCTPAATPTARSRAPSRRRSASTTSRSRRSWSTPSSRSSSARARWRSRTRRTPGPGPAAVRTPTVRRRAGGVLELLRFAVAPRWVRGTVWDA